MLELEAALARISTAIPPPEAESIALVQAQGRILLETLLSPVDLPLFDNSAMDGYAVRSADVADARSDSPVRLRLIGKAAAGLPFAGSLNYGGCVRVFTGSMLPEGADSVVMQEDTQFDSRQAEEILVLEPVKPWENVRLRGEDLKTGATIGVKGDGLTAGRLGLLAAAGVKDVTVGKRPRVGLMATGTELREAGNTLAPGQIYESNRTALFPLMERAGAVVRIFPLVADSLTATRAAIDQAFRQCDILVTSGGVSVGEMDFIREAFEQAGGRLEFWKVAIKPGRPFVLGRRANQFLFGLPGNPVSAFVTFLLLARPALLRWQGASETGLMVHPGILAEPLANPGDRRHFMRVKVGADGSVYSPGVQASHALASLAEANGLVDVPAQTTLAAGSEVKVARWD
jgi:molybdopterin molybdotransferase